MTDFMKRTLLKSDNLFRA